MNGQRLAITDAEGRFESGSARAQRILPRLLIVLYSVSSCARGYFGYRQSLRAGGIEWYTVLRGTADAPEQYRVGVVRAADLLSRLHPASVAGLRLSYCFAIFDLAGMAVALLLLLGLLERSEVFRVASATARWFAVATFLALALYALDWTMWYQRVGTLPSCGLTAVWLWLWTCNVPADSASPFRGSTARLPSLLRATTLVAVIAALSTIRADLALFLAAGVFFSILLRWTGPLALPHGRALLVSSLSAISAVAIQLYLMRVVYPQATYGITPVFMLRHDLHRLTGWAMLLIFTAPTLWTLWRIAEVPFVVRCRVAPGPAAGLLLTAPAYLLLWITFGRLDEVRIFLPVALALLPTTVAVALHTLMPKHEAEAGTAGPGIKLGNLSPL